MYRVASISDKGWISDDKSTLSYVFGCYMLTDSAQTLLYSGRLINLPQTYYQFINDPDGMANAVISDLSNVVGAHFPQVDVKARAKQISGSHYAILMQVTATTESNERIQLAKLMEIDNDNLRKILDVNNYGDLESTLF